MNSATPAPLTTHREQSTTSPSGWVFLLMVLATLVVAVSEPLGEVPADAPVVDSEPQEPAEAPAEAPVPNSPRGSRASRKGARA